MSCSCARSKGMFRGWSCEVSGDSCMFLRPNARACATVFGEGPEAEGLKQFVFTFYTFDGIKNSMAVYGKDERDARIRLREYYGKICKIELFK